MDQYPKIDSIGSIGSIILATLEVQASAPCAGRLAGLASRLSPSALLRCFVAEPPVSPGAPHSPK